MLHFLQEVSILTWRSLKHLRREPFNIIFTLIQPVLWLFLFGHLFQNSVQMPGLPVGNYLTFLTAGVIVMTIFGNSMAGGIPLLFDKENGFLLKLLVAPISRSAILVSTFCYSLSVSLLQALLILFCAVLMGVRVATGVWGIGMILLVAALLGIGITALSLALAFVLRGHGEFFAIIGFLTLPLIFLSNALVALEAMPTWIYFWALLNPMTYAIDGIRALVMRGWEWSLLLKVSGVLAVFDSLCIIIGIRVFQRNVE